MDALHRIAEEKIRAAIDSGMLDNLPGAGRPLDLGDDSRVPDDLRLSYRVLKNAGVLPEELELRQSLLRLTDLLAACTDDGERARLTRERRDIELRYLMMRERREPTQAWAQYRAKILRR